MTTHDQQINTTTSARADQPLVPADQSPVPADQPSSVPADQPSSAHTDTDLSRTQPAPITATDEPTTASSTAESGKSSDRSLFADNDLSSLRSRWDDVQVGFVDDPKDCVQKADALVADVVQQLTTGFSDARSRLEEQWARGEQASTEDLRQALKRYREFFERLLAV
jgi:hypothetical protein